MKEFADNRKQRNLSMKNYQQLTKKQLIEFIGTIRPKADAYDGVCQALGIENNIMGYIRKNCKQDVANPIGKPGYRLKNSKGVWVFEVSSGFPGYRCQNCATWVYEEQEKVCVCDKKSEALRKVLTHAEGDELVPDGILESLGFELPLFPESDKGYMFIQKELKIFYHQRPTYRKLAVSLRLAENQSWPTDKIPAWSHYLRGLKYE